MISAETGWKLDFAGFASKFVRRRKGQQGHESALFGKVCAVVAPAPCFLASLARQPSAALPLSLRGQPQEWKRGDPGDRHPRLHPSWKSAYSVTGAAKDVPTWAIQGQSIAASAPGGEEQEPIVLAPQTVLESESSAQPFRLMGGRVTGNGRGAEPVNPGLASGTTAFFQIVTQAKVIVYVVDRSASMGLNGSLAAAKRELLASLDRLPPSARFQVIVYNRTAQASASTGIPAWSSRLRRTNATLLACWKTFRRKGGRNTCRHSGRPLLWGPRSFSF